MLSILRKQSQQLEKELLEVRQALKAQQADHALVVAEKDAKIAELEHARQCNSDEVVLCRACAAIADDTSADGEGAPAAAEPTKLTTDELCSALDDIKARLRATETKLTMEELERSLAELRIITESSRIRRELTRTIEGTRAAARAAATKAAEDLSAAQAEARRVSRELASCQVEVSELKAGATRRDEQIAFLMQVHDASQECEWVPVNGAAPPPARWACNVCTLENAAVNARCEACGSQKT